MPERGFQFGQNCFHLRLYRRHLLDSFLETAPRLEDTAHTISMYPLNSTVGPEGAYIGLSSSSYGFCVPVCTVDPVAGFAASGLPEPPPDESSSASSSQLWPLTA